MWSQDVRPSFSFIARWLVVLVLVAGSVLAQTLHVERLPGGTELLYVTQALSAATTVSWPGADGDVESITRGELNLLADAEQVLGAVEPAPRVVIAVGGSDLVGLRAMVDRALGGRGLADAVGAPPRVTEGGIDRRLGPPGSRAQLRLEVPLPAPDDGRRSSVEVLWEMLPDLLRAELPGIRARVDGDLGRLEGELEPDLAELELRRLRLALARLGDSVLIDEDAVTRARVRLAVRRKALLGIHPDAAQLLVERWQAGGVDAVRQFLFGIDGVTEVSVRSAAAQWLPNHPGGVVFTLPPQYFNPRFAQGPQIVQLDNDLMAAVLERPGAGLATVCLRPVLLPDVDGQVTATVLARVAAELRTSGSAPGWIRVMESPPMLELATTPDGLPELMEVVQAALDRVAEDNVSMSTEGAGSRRRALDLMAMVLGLAEGVELSPAALLRPGNLAVGVVAPDSETAIEAMGKFGLGGSSPPMAAVGQMVDPVPRTREAAAGNDSSLVVAIEFAVGTSELVARAVADLVVERAGALEVASDASAIHPVVPGRRVALVVLSGEVSVADLERRTGAAWPKIIAPVTESELAQVRRRLASEVAISTSGPLGSARSCAAAAAGDMGWRKPADLEMEIVTLPAERLDAALGRLPPFAGAVTTGAGVLPVPEGAAP